MWPSSNGGTPEFEFKGKERRSGILLGKEHCICTNQRICFAIHFSLWLSNFYVDKIELWMTFDVFVYRDSKPANTMSYLWLIYGRK
jgi:hypothetical protein